MEGASLLHQPKISSTDGCKIQRVRAVNLPPIGFFVSGADDPTSRNLMAVVFMVITKKVHGQ